MSLPASQLLWNSRPNLSGNLVLRWNKHCASRANASIPVARFQLFFSDVE